MCIGSNSDQWCIVQWTSIENGIDLLCPQSCQLLCRWPTDCRQWCCTKVASRHMATTLQWCSMRTSGITAATCRLMPCRRRQHWLHLLLFTCVCMSVKVSCHIDYVVVWWFLLLCHFIAILLCLCQYVVCLTFSYTAAMQVYHTHVQWASVCRMWIVTQWKCLAKQV